MSRASPASRTLGEDWYSISSEVHIEGGNALEELLEDAGAAQEEGSSRR